MKGKTIKIQHLYGFEILVTDLKNIHGIENEMPKDGGAGFTMATENGAVVAFHNYEKNKKNPEFALIVAHELVHVLQIICEKFKFRFENEQEHMAWLLTYLMSEIFGLNVPEKSETKN